LRDKNIIWLYLFLIATIVDLSFLTEQNDSMRVYSKPVILLGLILYFYFISKPIASTLLAKTILAALLFSWLGDILLLWSDLFIYGLGAFLMAHVCYIFGFRLAQLPEGRLDFWYTIRSFFYTRFYKDFPEAGILIMGTYATAQLLLVMGIRSYLVGAK